MRGDLVYEKLGEIDPDLLADALPPAAVTPPLYQLGSNQSIRPPRAPRVRKIVLICACLALAVLLLAGGAVVLSRFRDDPREHGGDETTAEPPLPPKYEGAVYLENFGELTGRDSWVEVGERIKEIFNTALPVTEPCDCYRNRSLWIGDTRFTYSTLSGCICDENTGTVYHMADHELGWFDQALYDIRLEHPNNRPLQIYDSTGSILLYDSAESEWDVESIIAVYTVLQDMEPTKEIPEGDGEFILQLTHARYTVFEGAVRDESDGSWYEIKDRETLIRMVEALCHFLPNGPVETPPFEELFFYSHTVCRYGDGYAFYDLFDSGIDTPFSVREVYLLHTDGSEEYRVPAYRGGWHNSPYDVNVPTDAPFGEYRIVAVLYISGDTSDQTFVTVSETPAITVVPMEKEPAYTFTCAIEQDTFVRGDSIVIYAGIRNLGDTIRRFTDSDVIFPKVQVGINAYGTYSLYDLYCSVDGAFYKNPAVLESGDYSEVMFYMSDAEARIMPCGTYDVIISFEGHQQVFEDTLTVVAP